MNDKSQNQQQQAGWVFSPNGAATPPTPQATPQASASPQQQAPVAAPVTSPLATAEVPAMSEQSPQITEPVDDQPSFYKQPQQDSNVFAWTASEYVAIPKNAGWFLALGLGSVVLSVAIYLLTKDVISIVAILAICIIVGVFAARKPRAMQYALDRSGVHMGEKLYPYAVFKSFSIVADGASSHISLMPLKRFMPPTALHYAPEDEDKIIDTLNDYLPYEEHKADMVENISRRVRF